MTNRRTNLTPGARWLPRPNPALALRIRFKLNDSRGSAESLTMAPRDSWWSKLTILIKASLSLRDFQASGCVALSGFGDAG